MRRISVDTEDTGSDFYHNSRPYLVTICESPNAPIYFEWDVDPLTRNVSIPQEDVLEIREIIGSADELILQNSKFDYTALREADKRMVELWDWSKVRDTLIAAHLLASGMPKDLYNLGVQYLGINLQHLEDGIEKVTKEARTIVRKTFPEWKIVRDKDDDVSEDNPSASKTLWKLDMWLPRALCLAWDQPEHEWTSLLPEYANGDSALTSALWPVMWSEIQRKGLETIFYERMKLLPIAYDMEARGVTLSGKRMEKTYDEFYSEVERCEKVCLSIAQNYDYDLKMPKGASPNKSLTEFIFDVLQCPQLKHSPKTGKPSLDKEVMEQLPDLLEQGTPAYQFITTLSEKRAKDTACSYMRSYQRFQRPIQYDTWITDEDFYRLHPNLNPAGTAHLRWSCKSPNEQNLCVDGETEFLTGNGWIKAPELKQGDYLAQYWKDTGLIDFTEADIQISHFSGTMQHIQTEQGIDMLLTPNHRCLLQDRKTLKKFDVKAINFKSDCRHLQGGEYVNGYLELSKEEIIWYCAVQADGSYHKADGKEYGILFSFNKERKVIRLRDCMRTLGIAFSERSTRDGTGTSFYIGIHEEYVKRAKRFMPNKIFGNWILELSRESMDSMCEEVFNWDGDYTRKKVYSSSDKENADWVQILWTLSNHRATIASRMPSNEAAREHHYVNITENKPYSLTTNFTNTEIPWNDKVYCVTVPSSYIIIRRNGKVSITGNSKKPGSNLRYMFGPLPGREWYRCDGKNLELRIPAFEAGETELIEVFLHPNDPPYYGSYHLVVFDTLYPELFKEHGKECKELFEATYYQWVKNGNFALLYGAQKRKADITFHYDGAYELIKHRFPKMSALSEHYVRMANRMGYVETIPDKSVDPTKGYPIMCSRSEKGYISPTIPFNYHVSGTAMQWMNGAMIRCKTQLDKWNEQRGIAEDDYLNPDGFYIAMQVHDEMVFDMPYKGSPVGKSPLNTNLGRVKALAKLMEVGGDYIGVPTPVSIAYHEFNLKDGITIC